MPDFANNDLVEILFRLRGWLYAGINLVLLKRSTLFWISVLTLVFNKLNAVGIKSADEGQIVIMINHFGLSKYFLWFLYSDFNHRF